MREPRGSHEEAMRDPRRSPHGSFMFPSWEAHRWNQEMVGGGVGPSQNWITPCPQVLASSQALSLRAPHPAPRRVGRQDVAN
eukprot:8865175-Pyramimonas_sp.AAC.1